MNKKLISIAAAIIFGSLTTVTSYASPSDACLEARSDLLRYMDVVQQCKGYLPGGKWICESPMRSVTAKEKNNCLAIMRHKCRPDVYPDDPGGVCDPDTLEASVMLCPSVVGTWTVFIDAGCNGNGVNRTIVYSANNTWDGVGFPNGGLWVQDLCAIEMDDTFFNPPLIWVGTMTDNGNEMSGQFGRPLDGCWTATRIKNNAKSATEIPTNNLPTNNFSDSFYE